MREFESKQRHKPSTRNRRPFLPLHARGGASCHRRFHWTIASGLTTPSAIKSAMTARPSLPDLAYRRLGIVNVIFSGPPAAGDRGWVLVDAGVLGTKHLIVSAAEERFGKHARPSAIVLTHGLFDHVGAVEALSDEWDAPIYAHVNEFPDPPTAPLPMPPPDPSVGGGLISLSSFVVSTGSDQCAGPAAGRFLRMEPCRTFRMAVDRDTRSCAGACVALAGDGPRDDCGRCVHYHTSRVRICGADSGARDARAADVLHP